MNKTVYNEQKKTNVKPILKVGCSFITSGFKQTKKETPLMVSTRTYISSRRLLYIVFVPHFFSSTLLLSHLTMSINIKSLFLISSTNILVSSLDICQIVPRGRLPR